MARMMNSKIKKTNVKPIPLPKPPVKPKPNPGGSRKPIPTPTRRPKGMTNKAAPKKGGAFDPRQPGYVKPGGSLFDVNKNGSSTRRTTRGVGQPSLGYFDSFKSGSDDGYVKHGVNPRAQKASSGNPKPTNANMAAGKKATAKYKVNQAIAAKKKAIADAKKKATPAKAKGTAKKPTTGVYKRNPGGM